MRSVSGVLPAVRGRLPGLMIGAVMAMVSVAAAKAAEPAAEPLRIPVHVFAGTPRGPFQTGTFEELWIDSARDENTTSDPADKRHLMVQIWYPAAFKGDPPRAAYALHRDLYPHDEDASWMDDAAAVRTTSVLNAPLAANPVPFPVLLYNPGGGHPPFSGTAQTEYLASHGYVVVAIGHTGLTRIERFPDGYVYKPDVNDAEVSDGEAKGMTETERFRLQVKRYAERMMPVQVQDIRFVLDRLQAMNGDRRSRFHQRLNLDKVGSLGWSLGGALSLQATRDEPRVKAGVNLDGWLYTDVSETGTHRPIMQMHGAGLPSSDLERSAADHELATVADTRTWSLYAKTDADWYDLTLNGAEHGHFADRTLFERIDVALMHPRLAHDIVNRFTLEFFDKYLRGATETPLLSQKQVYPETTLLKSGAKK